MEMNAGYMTSNFQETEEASKRSVATFFLSETKKFRTTQSAVILMLAFFWNCKDPILKHYMPWENIADGEKYNGFSQNNLKLSTRSNNVAVCSAQACYYDNA